MTDLPLIGVLEETILPGEERTFGPPVIVPATLEALVGRRLCALSVASHVELPTLVTARWGTECTVLAVTDAGVTLRGERRARLIRARGKESPYQAEVETPDSDTLALARPAALLAGAHALVAALDAGATPDVPDWASRFEPAAIALARAVATKEELAEMVRVPAAEAITGLAKGIAARTQAQHASCKIETMMRELSGTPTLTPALRRRLWSQVVEIQRRLDVHDPSVAEEEGDDVARLQKRLMQAGLPKAARETAKRELRLLRGMSTSHHDYSTYLAHLDLMARLPWHADPPKIVDLDAVSAALDREHAGLEKAKRRVLEYLAVRALGGASASMILCLSGPPGVGKTSIARAIADALGRPFVRVPLGGIHDECEIRGHRMSFTAASAGRLIKGLAQAGSASAVVLLDEIDKVGTDRGRSPSAALLEVLDPEQNAHFQDNYLGVSYDLSSVLFIATANETSGIHPTLLDRMEPVELEGYSAREKIDIARRHLLSGLREDNGLPETPGIDDAALALVIEGYTREAGVRQLRRTLGNLFRARALELVRGAPGSLERPIDAEEITRVLGAPARASETVSGPLPAGVAAGMSVGPHGGSVLFVEVGRMPGKGRLELTGRLGEVMGETAKTALAHLKINAAHYGIALERFAADIHVHVPEAAQAKDGPSAGITLFAALLSSMTGTPLRAGVALTGEMTLTGRVLPVGGVRAKLLAAERAGVRRVILPEDNRADVPADLALEVVTVRDLEGVVRAAFPERAAANGASASLDQEVRS
jgi:ATP-dependent Lon protease